MLSLKEINENLRNGNFTERNVAMAILADYVDAEEQGLLIILPCKVGDAVYLILERLDNGKKEILISRCVRYSNNSECEVWSMWFDCDETGHTLEYDRGDFGKSVFLTREAAEEALKGSIPE
jgi:hypothetical protein